MQVLREMRFGSSFRPTNTGFERINLSKSLLTWPALCFFQFCCWESLWSRTYIHAPVCRYSGFRLSTSSRVMYAEHGVRRSVPPERMQYGETAEDEGIESSSVIIAVAASDDDAISGMEAWEQWLVTDVLRCCRNRTCMKDKWKTWFHTVRVWLVLPMEIWPNIPD